ncbi:MAG: preprotein translocase subunit SecG [Patescibacteria group bacterium]
MILNIVQTVLAGLMVAAILLQARGSGLGAAFGGEGNVFRTKRGIEKKLHYATIILAILFFGMSLANVLFDY